jgi:two-component system alkaline phosphatase synthesis response regulator PhoP
MPKILLVDDEPDILEFLKYNLEHQGFEVLLAHNGEEALNMLSEKPDLIVLDIMMPKMDGFETCKRIKAKKEYENIPIVFLTAKNGEKDEINGLAVGASDYIQKPVSSNKLIARVKLNLRKSDIVLTDKNEPARILLGPIEIDKEKYEVSIDGEKKVFPRKEFELLYFLVNNAGKVFSRESLLKEIWGFDVYIIERTVDVHIRKIREKLGKHSDLVETIKGVGYRFKNVQ